MPRHQRTTHSMELKSSSQNQVLPKVQIHISHPASIIQRAKINPESLTHADVMQLQRTIGNKAVGRLLSEIGLISSKAKQAPPVQMQIIPKEDRKPLQGKMTETIQLYETPMEEKSLQGKMIGVIQSQEILEEDEPLQKLVSNNPSGNIIQRTPVINTGEGELLSEARLQKQEGPSCWLFVLDAIFQEFGERNPILGVMGIAKFFYPSALQIAFLKEEGGNINREERILALEEIFNRITRLITLINSTNENRVRKNSFKNFAISVSTTTASDQIIREIFVENEELPKDTIINKLSVARDYIVYIKNRIEEAEKGKRDDETLLQKDRLDLGGDSAYGATPLTLKTIFKNYGGKFPMYMYLNSRFLAEDGENMDIEEVDWTNRTKIISSGPHAVLLVGANYGDARWQEVEQHEIYDPDVAKNYDDGFVIYKDPNYGNTRIKIKWSQLKIMMANVEGKSYLGVTSHR